MGLGRPESFGYTAELDEFRRNRDQNLRLEGKLETLEREIGAFRQREVERKVALQRSGEQLHRIQAEAEKLRLENKVMREAGAEMEAALRLRGEEVLRVQAERENLTKEISSLQSRGSEGQAELRRLRDQQARIEAESAAIVATLTSQRDAHRREATDFQAEVEAVKDSWSWRISAPLRWIMKPATKIRAGAMRVMYGTSAFRYTGKPLAKLLSNRSLPGARWLLPQNALFDAPFYRGLYPDAAKGSKNLWAHYLAYGSDESRDPHPLFSSAYYKKRYRDVAAAGTNPLVHYLEHGAREGRDPSPGFDTSYYLEHYQDVRESGLNPLIHFILHGRTEGRSASSRLASAAKSFPQVRPTRGASSSEVQASAAERTRPLISVVMPTYDTSPRYLRLAIESVLRQSYQGWQLCIYDDGSNAPETLEVLKTYEGRDPRIRIEFGSKNQGIASATNQAISFASGQYIAMLDHDDEIVPEALLEVANVLNSDSSIDVVYWLNQSPLERQRWQLGLAFA